MSRPRQIGGRRVLDVDLLAPEAERPPGRAGGGEEAEPVEREGALREHVDA